METRAFGRSGLRLSVLGFGCGMVGGLMVRGAPADQERTVARALDVGINYFDTAVQYGNGVSEENLGRVLRALKPANAIVGTKVRLPSRDFGGIGAAASPRLQPRLRRQIRSRRPLPVPCRAALQPPTVNRKRTE
ncbi:MAG: aldo/keto reductase [Acidobacteriota bacterium]